MSMLTRRTQVLLDEERYARLERRAAHGGQSIGALVRAAIDIAYPERELSREDAFEILRQAPRVDHGGAEQVQRDIRSASDPDG